MSYILITIFVLVIMLILAVVWVVVLKSKPSLPKPPDFTASGFGMRCVIEGVQATTENFNAPSMYQPQPCDKGLTCVQYSNPTQAQFKQEYGICKKSIGAPCTTVNECVPEAVACGNNVCSKSQTGGLNQQGPCLSPDLQENSTNTCKLKNYSMGCIDSSDCLAGSCRKGTCIPRVQNGAPCVSNYDCFSSNCDRSSVGLFCQPPRIKTGTKGSACGYHQDAVPQCNGGLSCNLDFYPSNTQVGETTYGICAQSVEQWPFDPCSSNEACLPPTICWGGSCVMPRSLEGFATNSCAAYNPSDNSNTTGKCIQGYKCDTVSTGAATRRCIPDGVTPVPYLSSNHLFQKWSLLRWKTKPLTSIGYWEFVANITQMPNSQPSLSVISVDVNRDLIMYQNALFQWCIIDSTIGEPILISGTNISSSGIQFQVQQMTLTVGGGLLVVYTITFSGGLRYNRSYLFPTIWEVFEFSGPASLPSKIEILIPKSQNSTSKWYQYVTSEGPLEDIQWVDVDDRLDSNNQIRILVIDAKGNLYTAVTEINSPNSVQLDLQPLPGIWWAQFYSFTKGVHNPKEFIYKGRNTPFKIEISRLTGASPQIQIPPILDKIPNGPYPILQQALYSPIGGGLAHTNLVYLVRYPSKFGNFGGDPQLRSLSRNRDVILPGYFTDDPRVQLGVTSKIPSISTSDFNPTYYIITPTSI